MSNKLAAVFNTIEAEFHRKAADEAQEMADSERSWAMFPRTQEAKAKAALQREKWAQAQAIADGIRNREHAAAYRAASALLKANRQARRGK